MLQFKTRCRVKETSTGEILSFSFYLGPIKIVCIANIPAEGKDEAPVYVKVDLEGTAPTVGGWTREPEVKR